jgi:hypothetical protein
LWVFLSNTLFGCVFVFPRLGYSILPVWLDCSFLVALLVFSNVYFLLTDNWSISFSFKHYCKWMNVHHTHSTSHLCFIGSLTIIDCYFPAGVDLVFISMDRYKWMIIVSLILLLMTAVSTFVKSCTKIDMLYLQLRVYFRNWSFSWRDSRSYKTATD